MGLLLYQKLIDRLSIDPIPKKRNNQYPENTNRPKENIIQPILRKPKQQSNIDQLLFLLSFEIARLRSIIPK
jgi:hypothetical protein